MGKKTNEGFLASYMELDRVTSEMFGISIGGVTEYINKLNNARFAPGREEALPRLVRYRNLRNKLAHEPGAIRRISEITKQDTKWVKGFAKDVVKGRDPISIYLKKARRYSLRRKIYKGISLGSAVILILSIIAFILHSCMK